MSSRSHNGIFCLEGDWDDDLRIPTTMQPVFDLLAKSQNPPVPSIRRNVSTEDGLRYYLRKWIQRKYRDFPLLYLGFHGEPGGIYISGRQAITLDWLEDCLHGNCHRRVIHFGSCSTMMEHGRRLNRFLSRTGALAVCGYRTDVDWMLTAAFEVILLSGFQLHGFTRAGMRAAQRRVVREAGNLARDLRFRMVIAQ